MMSSRPRKRQKYVARSCFTCRKRKIKCILPDVAAPSNSAFHKAEKACARCLKMGLECVAWGEGDSSLTKVSQSQSRTDPFSSDTDKPNKRDILSPFYPVEPKIGMLRDENEQKDVDKQCRQEKASQKQESLSVSLLQSSSSENAGTEKIRVLKDLRRPMSMMIRLLERQNIFQVRLPAALIQAQRLKGHCGLDCNFLLDKDYIAVDLGLIAQHPHLPRIGDLYNATLSSPSTSRTLLLYTMLYLCRLWDVDKAKRTSREKIASELISLVYHLSMQVFLSAPARIEAAQAFELIAVHLPFLLHRGSEMGEAEYGHRKLAVGEDSATAGTSLIAIAIRIVLSLRMEPHQKEEVAPVLDVKKVLWTSLKAWELSLSLQDKCTMKPIDIELERDFFFVDLFVDAKDDTCTFLGKLTRTIGLRALFFRTRAIVETAKCEIRIETILNAAQSHDDLKDRQSCLLNAFHALVKDQGAERCKVQDEVKDVLLAQNFLCEQAEYFLKMVDSLSHITWLWLDLEMHGMYQVLLTKAIGDIHDLIIQEKELAQSHEREEGANMQHSAQRIDFRQRIWEDSEWSEHITIFGKRRNEVMLSLLSRACRLGHHFRELRQSSKMHGHGSSACYAVLPVTLLSSFLVNAAKSLLDTQIVLLQVWRHMHQDTDMYLVVLRQAAEILSDQNCDLHIVDPNTKEGEPSIGKCCADIMHLIADTISIWQDKQKIDHTNSRIDKLMWLSEDRPCDSNVDDPISCEQDSVRAGKILSATNGSVQPSQTFYERAYNPFTSSAPFIFDEVTSFDSLADGMFTVDDWNTYFKSFNSPQSL